MRERIYGFDLLRGICALSVAISHVIGTRHDFPMHNLSLYAVYIFFALSGASLFVAYSDRLSNETELRRYFINRMLRIVPLYALVSAIYWISAYNSHPLGIGYYAQMFLNVTLLFGLDNPGGLLLVVGGWSLGIEFAFYLMFPIINALMKTRYWIAIAVLAMVAQHAAIELTLNQKTLDEAWVAYCQPLSFLGYFVVGCAIGRMAIDRKTNLWAWTLIIGALAFIALYQPLTPTASLKGYPGLLLSVVCCIAVLGAAYLPAKNSLSVTLGDASYGLYLIHVPVFLYFKDTLAPYSDIDAVVCVLVVAIPLAIISNRYFEMPIRKGFTTSLSWLRPRQSNPIP